MVYTLKPYLGKFKKKGFGPCVIEEISSSGAVKLSTLDGEIMSNWISGCRVKKYYTPLTTKELEHLHKAKWRQEKRRLVAESAREEARERARKQRNGGVVPFDQGVTKRRKFKIIKEDVDQDLEEETPQPLIAICTGDEKIQTYAFIDSGADGNTISYELYTKLHNTQLKQTNVVFQEYESSS